MLTASNASPKARASHVDRKQSSKKFIRRTKPGLAVDTSFTRHHGQVPQQVFPYESKTQELSFIGVHDVVRPRHANNPSLKSQLENQVPSSPTAKAAVSEDGPSFPTVSPTYRNIPFRQSIISDGCGKQDGYDPPIHKGVKRLRPSPLDLAQEVSPCDRAITIGMSMPPAPISHNRELDQSIQSCGQPHRHGRHLLTPTIVVTPAKEEFSSSPCSQDFERDSDSRPASSVYSTNTSCVSRIMGHGSIPMIPHFPSIADGHHKPQHRKNLAEEISGSNRGERSNILSVCTIFEEDRASSRPAPRASSQLYMATPRRSRGWWNVITSPFSATSGSRTGTHFWRTSPLCSATDELETRSILRDTSEMGYADPHAGLVFTNRHPDDDAIRSAEIPSTESFRPVAPKRSETAPGALSTDPRNEVDIYWIPSQGLAAPYYDIGRHFPSLIFEAGPERSVEDVNGWSPSNSVFRPERSQADSDASQSRELDELSVEHAMIDDTLGLDETGDKRNRGHPTDVDGSAPMATQRSMFATPSEDELHTATLSRPTCARNDTTATVESYFSPLTATPVVEEAHTATCIGPQSSDRGMRKVELVSARSVTPPTSSSMKAEASENNAGCCSDEKATSSNCTEKPVSSHSGWQSHLRSDSSGSRGLGIFDEQGEKARFPLGKSTTDQPYLATDRFGQLIIRRTEDAGPVEPWYRRFRWYLLAALGGIFTLTVVLLVMLVPARHTSSTPVQANWLNLTSFPPVPTGISTVLTHASGEVKGCASPQGLWSCTAPNDSQNSPFTSDPDAVAFRFEISFRKGKLPRNETTLGRRSSGSAVHASRVIRDANAVGAALTLRGWINPLLAADPVPPTQSDQTFIGQTTDNVSAPFNGVETPFYVSVLDPMSLQNVNGLHKRQDQDVYPYPTATQNSTGPASNATASSPASIPRPILQTNGQPAPTELYPFVQAQPLQLYNRGGDDEHYGFYTYFDRSVFVSNVSDLNSADLGSVPLDNASAVCTWAQTRFHVQIWTGRTVTSLNNAIPLPGLPAVNSTANGHNGPGSFPYAVTVTLDRHGGDSAEKGLYCYAIDQDKHVVASSKTWVAEDRAFSGVLVNPAIVPGADASANTTVVHRRERPGQTYGGTDGGSGGCSCAWQNWK